MIKARNIEDKAAQEKMVKELKRQRTKEAKAAL